MLAAYVDGATPRRETMGTPHAAAPAGAATRTSHEIDEAEGAKVSVTSAPVPAGAGERKVQFWFTVITPPMDVTVGAPARDAPSSSVPPAEKEKRAVSRNTLIN